MSFPLQILVREERSYCVTDDDGEAHGVRMVDAQGRRVLQLVAGEACRTLTLDPGAYNVTLTHAKAGRLDASPDVFHTKLNPATSPPEFVFASNECIGCNFGSIGVLPSLGGERSGLRGNYAGLTVSAICEQNKECTFLGDYARASLDITTSGHNVVTLGQTFTDARLTLRFSGAQLAPSRVRGVKGSDYTFAALQLLGDVAGYVLEGTLCDGYEGYAGPIVVNKLAYDGLMRPLVDGAFKACPTQFVMRGPDWRGSYFRSSPYIAYAFTPEANRPYDFSGATMTDFQVPANVTQPSAKFDGATLERVSFADGADLQGISFRKASLRDVSAVNANLDGVIFLESTIHTLDLSGARSGGTIRLPERITGKLDASNGDFRHLVANQVVIENANFSGSRLDDATFQQSTLAYGVFEGARLTRTSFRQAALEATSFACAYGIATEFSGVDAEHVILDNAHFYAPKFAAPATLRNGSAVGTYICGNASDAGAASGLNLPGGRLPYAFFPRSTTQVWEPAEQDTVACGPFTPQAGDTRTVCPDNSSGPCSGNQWVPSRLPPATCAANDPGCAAQGSARGTSCTGACECLSRKCSKSGRCL